MSADVCVCVCQCVFRVLSSGRVRAVDITQSHGQAGVSANCIKRSFQSTHPPPFASFTAQPIPVSHQSEFSHQGLPWSATSCLRFPEIPCWNPCRNSSRKKTSTHGAKFQQMQDIQSGFPEQHDRSQSPACKSRPRQHGPNCLHARGAECKLG